MDFHCSARSCSVHTLQCLRDWESRSLGLPALYTVCGRDPAFMLPNAGARMGHFQSQPQPQPGEGPEGPKVLSERQYGQCELYDLANLDTKAHFRHSWL